MDHRDPLISIDIGDVHDHTTAICFYLVRKYCLLMIRPFMFDIAGVSLGCIGIFCLAFMFLPIAMGSMLLRLMDIPFGHATRYHIWLAHLTVFLFLLHGICFTVEWSIEGVLLEEILKWKK